MRERAARLKLLVLDVDGVLTDGSLVYSAEGEQLKVFHVRDGLGIKLLQQQGIEVAVISGKVGGPLKRRLDDLGVRRAYLGREDKKVAFQDLLEAVGCAEDEVGYVGDDLIDLPVMRRVGLPMSIADGHACAREAAAFVSTLPGGRGAVREIADAILDARGEREAAYARYLEEHGG
ncbi:MAG: HAD-IIIA family hydrolase [Sandaracinaceae bacterium]|nr:MAG: HAD-IIIA family hydrolase [Sandaracinaceae bacterium]